MTAAAPQQETEFTDDPRGWAQRWRVELDAAHKATEGFRAMGKDAVARFRDERDSTKPDDGTRRWNLYYAGVSTALSLLYGQVPKVSVERRFADAADDVARVASEILDRLLNTDLDANHPFVLALRDSLQDRMLPGLGVCRVMYDVEMEPVPEIEEAGAEEQQEPPAPDAKASPEPDGDEAAPAERKKPGTECAEVSFVHWDDFRWSAGARVWPEVTWVAFRSLLSRKQLVERFGDVGRALELNARKVERNATGKESSSPWDRAEVWEVWDKDTRRVYWLAAGHPTTLDMKEDPLQLEGFFPCPRPMAANLTTDAYLPRADYALSADLYAQIDEVQTRVGLLVSAIRAAGVYDSSSPGIKKLLDPTNGNQNELYPVDNWALFAEKGGIKGQVDWLPLEPIANAILALEGRQDRLKAQLYEVTGMSDILRGQGEAGFTATEQDHKVRFASARLQALQDDFARFASDVADLRAQLICSLYEPESILAAANMANTPDMKLAQQAIALLKSPGRKFRVQVKPEALASSDFAQLKEERMGALGAVGSFMQSMAPLATAMPGSMPFLLQFLQFVMAGMRGFKEAEGIFDAAIAQAKQAAQQPPPQQQEKPDPKLQLQVMKGQQDMQRSQLEHQQRMQEKAADMQVNAQHEQVQREENVKETLQKAVIQQQFHPQVMPGLGGQKP